MDQFAANAVLLLHLVFIGVVLFGGLAVWRWPRLAWIQIPAALWGALVEAAGWPCPLTDVEDYFLHRAGKAGYDNGFLADTLLAIIYPEGLTRDVQWGLAMAVVAVNVIIYVWTWCRSRYSPRIHDGKRR